MSLTITLLSPYLTAHSEARAVTYQYISNTVSTHTPILYPPRDYLSTAPRTLAIRASLAENTMAAAAASAAALDPSNSTKNTLKLENVRPCPSPSIIRRPRSLFVQ